MGNPITNDKPLIKKHVCLFLPLQLSGSWDPRRQTSINQNLCPFLTETDAEEDTTRDCFTHFDETNFSGLNF